MAEEREFLVGYIGADCANCGRQRLELFVERQSETALGIRCEKCFATWSLSAEAVTGVLIYGPFFTERDPHA